MCGIAGVLGKMEEGRVQKEELVIRKFLGHRGPDGYGRFSDGRILLSHLRLSIIDLSEQGNQPLYNEDRSLVLICNGEIYNYKELRQKLLQLGHRFSSNSDSEVILHLYEEYSGDLNKMLNMMTGMFAFALWDTKSSRLFIARDRMGIKPLYYCSTNEHLVFASEVRPIAMSGLADFCLDYTSLYEYFLIGSIPGPNTLYQEIKCLEPGHYILAEAGRVKIQRYWEIPHARGNWKSLDEVTEVLDPLLDEVIKEHLCADVPVGAFLSAGIDSSLITSYAGKHNPRIHTFTATFPGEPEDEGEISERTSKVLNTTHRVFSLKGNFFKDFDKQFSPFDQPFANASALSLGRISELARADVKVVLSGDGGDELFAGYNRHSLSKYPSFVNYLPGKNKAELVRLLGVLSGKKSLQSLSAYMKQSETSKYIRKFMVTDEADALDLLDANARKQVDVNRYPERMKKLFDGFNQDDVINKLLYVDCSTTLVDEMLTKCDRMTMINGIEGRVPFLDHRIVELAFSIPSNLKKSEKFGKMPLRKILASKLGDALAYREKTGFNSPLRKWLKEDPETKKFAQDKLEPLQKLGFLNTPRINNIAHTPGDTNHSDVFALICLSNYFEGQF